MRFFAAIAALTTLSAFSAQAGEVWLTIDQVRPYEIERPAGQIVVGNPSIADLTVSDKSRVLLFGKAPGVTNMYIFDDKGGVIENLVVRVQSVSSEMLTMHRGPVRTTYNCSNLCEATITVGDDLATFSQVTSQVQQKQSQANASADAPAQ